jgi:hypothetical protein
LSDINKDTERELRVCIFIDLQNQLHDTNATHRALLIAKETACNELRPAAVP